jgi:hypothetical protein
LTTTKRHIVTEIRALIPLSFLLILPISNRLRDAISDQQLFKMFMQRVHIHIQVLKLKREKAQESVLFCLVRFKFFIDLIRHLTPTKEQFQVFENGWKEMG